MDEEDVEYTPDWSDEDLTEEKEDVEVVKSLASGGPITVTGTLTPSSVGVYTVSGGAGGYASFGPMEVGSGSIRIAASSDLYVEEYFKDILDAFDIPKGATVISISYGGASGTAITVTYRSGGSKVTVEQDITSLPRLGKGGTRT